MDFAACYKRAGVLYPAANVCKADKQSIDHITRVFTQRNHYYNVVYKPVAHTSELCTPPTLRTSTIVYLNNVVIQCTDIYRVD
jgi:hypothetical protein